MHFHQVGALYDLQAVGLRLMGHVLHARPFGRKQLLGAGVEIVILPGDLYLHKGNVATLPRLYGRGGAHAGLQADNAVLHRKGQPMKGEFHCVFLSIFIWNVRLQTNVCTAVGSFPQGVGER